MGKIELFNDRKGSTSMARMVLFLWTAVPLAMWVAFSVVEGHLIELNTFATLENIIYGVCFGLGSQYIGIAIEELKAPASALLDRVRWKGDNVSNDDIPLG